MSEEEAIDILEGVIPEDQPEVQPDKAAEPEPKKEEPAESKTVPHAALHEARENSKALKRQLEEERQARIRLEERTNRILEAMVRQPEPELDPFESVVKQVNQVTEKVDKVLGQSDAERKRITDENAFIERYRNSAGAFAKDQPDFHEAYAFLMESRERELSKVIKDPAKRMAHMRAEERMIVEEAFSNEENPGQALYEIAKERGYKKQAESPKKTIEDVEKTVEVSRTLGPGGKPDSGGGIETLSARELMDLPDSEFEKGWEELKRRAARRA